jgi:hypothetical protein
MLSSSIWKLFVGTLILTSVALPAIAVQPARSELPGTNEPRSAFPRHPPPLARSSGYIFAGTVKSVERITPKGNGVTAVQISFHVDQAMQGVRAGQMLAIREWAGLWESGERYRPGERFLLFLYPPSKLGLTSPVRGPLGCFKIGPDGRVVVDPGRIGVPAPRPVLGDRFRGRTSLSPRELVRLFRSEEEE